MDSTSTQREAAAVAPAARELFCPQCGYNLRGITSDRCPECGTEVDRAKIGRVRAYVRTAWLATISPNKLAMEMARPVPYEDARKFWLVTVAVAWVSVGAIVVAEHITSKWDEVMFGVVESSTGLMWGVTTPRPWLLDVVLPLGAGLQMLPVTLGAVLAFLLLVTGVVSWFFHPKSMPVVRQNRAVALSCYACAPLAWTPLPVLVVFAGAMMKAFGLTTSLFFIVMSALAVAFALIPVLQIVALYTNTLRLVSVTTRDGARVWLAAFVLPVMWVVIALLTLVGIPWVAGFFWLVVASLG